MKNMIIIEAVKRLLAFSVISLVPLSFAQNEEDKLQKDKLVNPWDKYDEFTDVLTNHREEILKKITNKEVCAEIVDEFIQDRVQRIQPERFLRSNKELVEYMKGSVGCNDYKIQGWEYRVGPNSVHTFILEPPYRVYLINIGDSKYIGFIPSGARFSSVAKTHNVVDFEDVSAPGVELWDAHSCARIGGAGSMSQVNQEFNLGIVVSDMYGLLSYVFRRNKSSFSVSIKSLVKAEKVYCSAPAVIIGE